MATELHVFISSKMLELQAEREAIFKLIPTLSNQTVTLIPWAYEASAEASENSIREIYLDQLRDSALYIGIFWNEHGIWTMDEFDRASEWRIPRHLYVKNVDIEKRDPQLKAFLEKHADVERSPAARWFKTLDDLRDSVKHSIEVWLEERLLRRMALRGGILAQRPGDLPGLPESFIGRENLLDEIDALFGQQRRILLSGFGGAGKTALAAAIGERWLKAHQTPVLWLRVGIESTNELLERLADAFQAQQAIVAQPTTLEKIDAVKKLLTPTNDGSSPPVGMVILDDIWVDGEILGELLQAIPRDVPVLMTSRSRFSFKIVPVENLDEPDALRVLSLYAYHEQGYGDDPDAAQLCKKLGYNAYALMVAGSILNTDIITPAELLQRIADAPHDLAMPEGMAEEGHRSVKELLDTSIDLLTPEVRAAFEIFGALYVPDATPALIDLCLRQAGKPVDTSKALSMLVRRGLADRESDGSYRLHDLAYTYAKSLFAASGQSRTPIIQACREYVRINKDNMTALDSELNNLLKAAEFALETADDESLVELMHLLTVDTRYLEGRGEVTQRLDLPANLSTKLLNAAAQAAHKLKQTETAHYLESRLGNYYANFLGNLDEALPAYQKALKYAQDIQNPDREALLLSAVGVVRLRQNQPDADTYLEKAYHIAKMRQDDHVLSRVLEHRGACAYLAGELERASEHYTEAIEAAERLKSDSMLFYPLISLAGTYQALKDLDRARQLYLLSKATAERMNDSLAVASAYQGLGEVDHAEKLHDQAQANFERAFVMYRQAGAMAYLAELRAVAQDGNYSLPAE